MDKREKPHGTIVDFVTGQTRPDRGAEANRQRIERFLVETKKYEKADIEVDAAITLKINGEIFQSTIDLVVRVNNARYMVIKCAAGSLASREREVIAAARLLEDYQIPISVASDGATALVWDTVSGDSMGKGLEAIPSKAEGQRTFDPARVVPMKEDRRLKHKLVFRTYATTSCSAST